jgi:hypothetical protein
MNNLDIIDRGRAEVVDDKAEKNFWNVYILNSWWVYLFCIFSFFLFNHFSTKKKAEIEELSQKYVNLESQRDLALTTKENLNIQICSQSDPSWIEIVLMKQLGLVPDGYMKIHFKKE